MATTYLKSRPARRNELLTQGDVYNGGGYTNGYDSGYQATAGTAAGSLASNGQPAASSPVAVLEEMVRYIACRCAQSFGGSAKPRTVSSTDAWHLKLGIGCYPYLAEVRVRASSASSGNSITVTSDTDSTGVTMTVNQSPSATSIDSAGTYRAIIAVGAGTPAAPSIEDVTVTVTVAVGNVTVWGVTAAPIPIEPTQSLTV